MQKVLAQFNRYPFFLFLTYKKEARLDLEKMEVHTVIEEEEYNEATKQMETVTINRVLWHIGTKHDMVLKNCLKSL